MMRWVLWLVLAGTLGACTSTPDRVAFLDTPPPANAQTIFVSTIVSRFSPSKSDLSNLAASEPQTVKYILPCSGSRATPLGFEILLEITDLQRNTFVLSAQRRIMSRVSSSR